MRAIVYEAPRRFAIREMPTPEPDTGEIRVSVIQSGLCGTDLHLHEGRFMASFPFTPGHEIVGRIDALGSGVTSFAEGELVTVNPNSACRACSYCRAGRYLYCSNFTGIGSNRPGGFADYMVAPASQVFSAEGMHPDVAVFTEPTACVAHGMDALAAASGSTALVIGLGPTGTILSQFLAASGALTVAVADAESFKVDRALSFGLHVGLTIDRERLDDGFARLMEISDGEGYDIVVDATGVPAVIERCVALVRNGGTVLVYGVAVEDDRVSLSPFEIFRREITIKGSFAEIDGFPPAIRALRAGRVRTEGLITHRFGIEEYEEALETLRTDRTAHKIVIHP